MTDKVQKILSEITTRKLCTMDEHMTFYNDKAKEDYRFLSEIEEIIKVLQEESVKSVWHDVKEKPIYKNREIQLAVYGITTIGDAMSVCSLIDKNTIYVPLNDKEYKWGTCPFTKWAYVTDLLNPLNSCNKKGEKI